MRSTTNFVGNYDWKCCSSRPFNVTFVEKALQGYCFDGHIIRLLRPSKKAQLNPWLVNNSSKSLIYFLQFSFNCCFIIGEAIKKSALCKKGQHCTYASWPRFTFMALSQEDYCPSQVILPHHFGALPCHVWICAPQWGATMELHVWIVEITSGAWNVFPVISWELCVKEA